MRLLVLSLLISVPFWALSQTDSDTISVDQRYFEDQFYAGVTYNFILNQPNQVSQRNFSYGLQLGFVKDLPFNQKRTIGLGIGLGFGLNTYYTNIRAQEVAGDIQYTILTDVDFKRSKLETHLLEIPIEFRWRNSDTTTYSFWRIYTGIKFGYAFDSRSKYVIEDSKQTFKNTDVRKLQYGLTFNFGYHNFNMHIYYSLTPLFNDGVSLDNTQEIKIRPLQIGFMFYVL